METWAVRRGTGRWRIDLVGQAMPSDGTGQGGDLAARPVTTFNYPEKRRWHSI